jgi:hypothetical protein
MQDFSFVGAAILIGAFALPSFAGTNDLFEAKTATEGIKITSDNILSSATKTERKAKEATTKANLKALKAYGKCPRKEHKAEKALETAADRLETYQEALAAVATSSVELDALAAFSDATLADIDALVGTGEICDRGATLTQADDIDYVIDPAPFVNFASGWGTLFSSAHGTFGDFTAASAAPDHVHSGTYYGVVIGGLLKNPFWGNAERRCRDG